jgi:hypothetical protein
MVPSFIIGKSASMTAPTREERMTTRQWVLAGLVVVLLGLAAGCGRTVSGSDDAGTDTGNLDTDTHSGTDGDSDGDTDTDTDADTDTDGTCGYQLPIDPQPYNMLFLVDRSLSMSMNTLGTDTYAEVVAGGLDSMVAAHAGKGFVNFGMAVFPSPTCVPGDDDLADECAPAQDPENPVVPLADGSGSGIPAVLDTIGTCGATPMCGSIEWAKGYMTTGLPPDIRALPMVAVLVTDGAPNCDPDGDVATCTNTSTGSSDAQIPEQCLDDACTYDAATALRDAGYPLHVIGLGGAATDWGNVMDAIAEHGGTSSSHLADSAQALDDALATVLDSAFSCAFDLDWSAVPDDTNPPVDKACDTVRVYGVPANGPGEDIPFSPECKDPGAWHWQGDPDIHTASIEDCTVIELCPDACQKLKDSTYEGIVANSGCEYLLGG